MYAKLISGAFSSSSYDNSVIFDVKCRHNGPVTHEKLFGCSLKMAFHASNEESVLRNCHKMIYKRRHLLTIISLDMNTHLFLQAVLKVGCVFMLRRGAGGGVELRTGG